MIAQARAEQGRIIGKVVDASIERMEENRERREEERLEDERETDRLRQIERREQADALRTVRDAEQRAEAFRERARAGDRQSEVDEDRERGRAAEANIRARNAEIDIRA